MKVTSIAAFVLISTAPSAFANCQFGGPSFLPPLNDTVGQTILLSGGDTCRRAFTTHSLTFTGVTILTPPQHGSLSVQSVSSFSYRVKGGYKGADTFAVKVCASGKQGVGCSTLNYSVTVQ